MSQNGQTHFKNLAAFVAGVFDHFGTLCIKALRENNQEKMVLETTYALFYL